MGSPSVLGKALTPKPLFQAAPQDRSHLLNSRIEQFAHCRHMLTAGRAGYRHGFVTKHKRHSEHVLTVRAARPDAALKIGLRHCSHPDSQPASCTMPTRS